MASRRLTACCVLLAALSRTPRPPVDRDRMAATASSRLSIGRSPDAGAAPARRCDDELSLNYMFYQLSEPL